MPEKINENKLSFFKSTFEASSLPFAVLNSDLRLIYANNALKKEFADYLDPILHLYAFEDVDKATVLNCLKSEKAYELTREGGVKINLTSLFCEESGDFEGALVVISKNINGAFYSENNDACEQALNRELRDRINIMHTSIYAITQSKSFEPDNNMSILINSLNQNCYQLLRASDNLSRVMRISLGNDFANFSLINFSDYVKKLIGTIILMDNKNSVPIKLICEESFLPAQIDLSRMEFVISNIILNSIKYTRKGNEITVTLKKVGNNAILSISDKGVGMKKEVLDKVGTPYYSQQGDNLDTGFGIALFIAKKYVSYHGGSFSIQSRKSSGTTVSISIPLDIEKDDGITPKNLSLKSAPNFEPEAKFSQTRIQLSEVCYHPVI